MLPTAGEFVPRMFESESFVGASFVFYLSHQNRSNFSTYRNRLTSPLTRMVAGKFSDAMQRDMRGENAHGTCGEDIPMPGKSGEKGG